ncbi:MAG TPA: DUF2158 domain-containing protein [Vicinamibacterales bacterium]
MAEQQFKPGDLVRLKSGGPGMTVVKFGKFTCGEAYKCRWFDDKNSLVEDTFTEAELELLSQRRAGPSIRYATIRKGV